MGLARKVRYVMRISFESGRDNITEQFNENGDSPWLEGWICGYTDPDHGDVDAEAIEEELFEHLRMLRGE